MTNTTATKTTRTTISPFNGETYTETSRSKRVYTHAVFLSHGGRNADDEAAGSGHFSWHSSAASALKASKATAARYTKGGFRAVATRVATVTESRAAAKTPKTFTMTEIVSKEGR